MKWTVTFETVTRDDAGRVVSRVIDEKATKKFNTKHKAVEYLRSEGFGGYVSHIVNYLVIWIHIIGAALSTLLQKLLTK